VLLARIVPGTLLLVVAPITTIVAIAGPRPTVAVLSAAGLLLLLRTLGACCR